jgi:hypothetical protein
MICLRCTEIIRCMFKIACFTKEMFDYCKTRCFECLISHVLGVCHDSKI